MDQRSGFHSGSKVGAAYKIGKFVTETRGYGSASGVWTVMSLWN